IFWRRGGDSNPRYRFWPVQRFSKPPPSASRRPLRFENQYKHWRNRRFFALLFVESHYKLCSSSKHRTEVDSSSKALKSVTRVSHGVVLSDVRNILLRLVSRAKSHGPSPV